MKSGEFNIEISEDHFRAAIADILDRNFVQRIFHPRPALIAKKPVSGHRMWKEHKGEAFDPNEFEKVDGYWEITNTAAFACLKSWKVTCIGKTPAL